MSGQLTLLDIDRGNNILTKQLTNNSFGEPMQSIFQTMCFYTPLLAPGPRGVFLFSRCCQPFITHVSQARALSLLFALSLLIVSASKYRTDSRFALSQWETALLCNDVSHWLGASLESALQVDQYIYGPVQDCSALAVELLQSCNKP